MNNLQIIAVGTLVSVTLIESLLMNIRLTKALRSRQGEQVKQRPAKKTGFIDYKTGRRVDIDPVTKKEVFVD
ncbi:hypothetical protein [Streptococcus porci]|uniref:hypothetical protein n=1 Tax=Streptococcus porci TaxID=502567 RepID=UPI0004139CA7|nr:hypothetical protein [Streptococcus porci]